MEKIASKYTQKNAEKQLVEIYQGFVDARTKLFELALTPESPATPVTPVAEISLSPVTNISPEVEKNNLTN